MPCHRMWGAKVDVEVVPEIRWLFVNYVWVSGLGEDEWIVILRTIHEATVHFLAGSEVAKLCLNFNR